MTIGVLKNQVAIQCRFQTDFSAVELDGRCGSPFSSARLSPVPNIVVSAWQEDRIIGLALAVSDFQTLTCISEVLVHDRLRRQGVARELMRRVHGTAPLANVLLLATKTVQRYDPLRCARETGSAVREPAWLEAVDRILATEYARKVTVANLAPRIGVHRVHLSRAFRRYRDESMHQALRRRRVDAACRRLVETDVELAVLALDVGFSDQAQFSRAFKHITGTTPGAVRQLFQRARGAALKPRPLPRLSANAGAA